MCIIAIKKAGCPLPDDGIMETMFKNNPDGAGFMYNHHGKVIIQKGYMNYEAFLKSLREVCKTVDTYTTAMVFHFRIATHGGVNKALCHPFPISAKVSHLKRLHGSYELGIAHNGIIPIEPRKGISDTQEYILTELSKRAKLYPNFYKSKKHRKAILAEINNSRMAFLDGNGDVCTVGDFIEENGIIYSNSSYRERTIRFSLWDDYMSRKVVTPINEGYIMANSKLTECEAGQFFIDKYGRLYEYDFYCDFAYEITGTAYTINGMPVRFDDDNVMYINVLSDELI